MGHGLPEHLGPKYDIHGNPCGCMMITIPNRMAVAIPCVKHTGSVKVSMEYDPPNPDHEGPSQYCSPTCPWHENKKAQPVKTEPSNQWTG
jgi:hypothetical protein